ncbi:double-CXXCG motif protein [Corallococcus terminator]
MTRFFWLREDEAAATAYDGEFNAAHKWGLPGVSCPTCGATWSGSGREYPCVDLSHLPEHHEFEKARLESFPEFARLRELVRPLAPLDAVLTPGTAFGPLVGRAFGEFGPFGWWGNSMLLVRRETLEQLQSEGVQGLLGGRTELRFRKKNPPELLELQIELRGRLHLDCIPPDAPPYCHACGRHGFGRPDEPILDAASLPQELDLFRVGNFATMLIGTERFMDAVHRLGLVGMTFRELPTR